MQLLFCSVKFTTKNNLERSYCVHTDDIIRVTGKQGLPIGRPGQACARGDLAKFRFFGTKSINDNLGFKIPDLDRIVRGGTQPVTVGGEDQTVDDFASIKGV